MSSTTLEAIRPATAPAIPWAAVATEEQVQATAEALRARGFQVQVVDDGASAREAVLGLIPEGSEVNQGSSTTLDEIGLTDAVNESGRFDAVRPRLRSMDRATQGAEIRRLGSTPAWMIGSVHAITQTGSLVTASKSGSQLGPYASGAGKVIVVAGTNKIVSDLDEALRRIDEHSLPLEDARAQAAYGMSSSVAKVLIQHEEPMPGRTTVILIRDSLGY
ncbi:MAG: hypothetical protein QOH61_1495 [Chloroflexota bacterium]|jgi:urocanate hydratase|nr:hypothetical protein [Chloroflexota bacterium]